MRNKELVKWSETGDSIIITDINTFSDKILPEYFNHNNYSSFIRQLNMYGFRKQNKERKKNTKSTRTSSLRKAVRTSSRTSRGRKEPMKIFKKKE